MNKRSNKRGRGRREGRGAVLSINADVGEVMEQWPVLTVGSGEEPATTGRALIFTCDLRVNDYPEVGNWPEGETYCVTTERHQVNYGGVLHAAFLRCGRPEYRPQMTGF